MAQLSAYNVKLTRTPLAGGGSTVITEARDVPLRRIRQARASLTQSIGDQNGSIEVVNLGGYFDSWQSGDVLRVEVQRPQDSAYTLLLEGFIGEPMQRPGIEPMLSIPVVGLNSVLDLIVLNAEHKFENIAYTTMFDSLCTTYLTGYTRTITADAASGSMTFPEGMKLREALDIIRRSLIAATAPSKWEYIVRKDAATKEVRLFKRSSSILATLAYSEALEGTHRSRGSAYHVVNKAKVLGAVVPSYIIDRTALPSLGQVVLDATSDWVAQPFDALDTPLYSHTLYGDRSSGRDPPNLMGYVARNSNNVDAFAGSIRRRYYATTLRNAPLISGGTDITAMDDNDSASIVRFNEVGPFTDREFLAFDLGAGNAKVVESLFYLNNLGTTTWKAWGSNDDLNWTLLGTFVNNSAVATGSTTAYRYFRVTGTTASAGTRDDRWAELWFMEYKQSATDPTNPERVLGTAVATEATFTTTGGGQIKEMYRVDFGAPKPLIKVQYKHREGSASALVNIKMQKSSDGINWTDIAVLASATATVVDNIYLDGEGSFRHFRVITQDDRAGGSAAFSSFADYVLGFFHEYTWGEPLAGDAMRGSAWTWGVSNMVEHPAEFEPNTWPAPRLAVVPGSRYWLIYVPQSGASTTSFWLLNYAADPGNTEVLVNGSFEDYPGTTGIPTGWTNGGTRAASFFKRIAGLSGLGAYALEIEVNSGFTTILQQDLPALTPGIEYTARVMNQRVASGTPNTGARLRIYNITDAAVVVEVDRNSLDLGRLEARFVPVAGKMYRFILTHDTVSGAPAGNTSAHWPRFDGASVFPTLSPPTGALVSTTSGTVWSAVGGTLQHRTAFNEHELVGQAEDAASQAAFANFVPGGILYGGLKDTSLITQDMVDREAAALVAVRKEVKQRIVLVLPLRPDLVPGSQVRLDASWAVPFGTSGDFDILEATHDVLPGGKTVLILNDHPPETSLAVQAALAYSTGRSV